MRCRAWSTTSSVCTHTSPSGCHSGSCGHPTSALISGNRLSMTPRSSASARPIGRTRRGSRSFSISPQIRSDGRSSSGMAAAELGRLRIERELESRGELHRAQDAQAVVAERRRIDGAQHARLAGPPRPSNGSSYVAGQRIPRDRVDGEIAPPRSLLDRQPRIARHREAAMARGRPSTRVVAARRRDPRPCRR